SSNPSVVTVDDTGLILAMNPGVSTITTRTDNGVSTSYLLHVYYQYQAYLQDEFEENESFSTANIITQNGTTLNGSLRSNQDIDIYKVYLFKGDSISVFLSPEDVEHVPFYFVGFVDQNQQLLSMSLELNTYHILTSSVPANGYYYLFIMALPNAPFEEPSIYESFIYWE
ncbi:MAG: hypothetical protein PHP32_06925, partial [Candidatus Izemoplasmatales bacterium]|nr:hypothetical protein [Candidatus Izemoplasmatales bacterium]